MAALQNLPLSDRMRQMPEAAVIPRIDSDGAGHRGKLDSIV
jgi:hypothetical protein